MTPAIRLIPPVLALLLAACGEGASDQAPSVTSGRGGKSPPASLAATSAPTPIHTADRANDGYPDLAPAPLTAADRRGEKGARNILIAWARAIELREFDQAWRLMSPSDHERWNRREWSAMFRDLGEITIDVSTGRLEGAAGSTYYAAPTSIIATDANGRPVRMEGEVVLRRVNDVPGATPTELSWHIENVSLSWTH